MPTPLTPSICICFRLMNDYYKEYVELWKSKADDLTLNNKKIQVLTLLNFIELSTPKTTIIFTISNRHNDVFFENSFCTFTDLSKFVPIKQDRDLTLIIDSSTKKGVYTTHGYILKTKLSEFSDRWFTKIKY